MRVMTSAGGTIIQKIGKTLVNRNKIMEKWRIFAVQYMYSEYEKNSFCWGKI